MSFHFLESGPLGLDGTSWLLVHNLGSFLCGSIVMLVLPFLRLVIATLFFTRLSAQNGPNGWITSPFSPPALPLAVRSPYLNTWIKQGNHPLWLSNIWPNFWSGTVVTGWYAIVVIDGTAYKLMGSLNLPNVVMGKQTAAEFTPTRTSFIFTVGPMQVNTSFISPIEPSDLLRQSMPFSYMTISAASNDGSTHAFRIYTDISGEFIAGDVSQLAQWASDSDEAYAVLSMQLAEQKRFSENEGVAQDATELYCFKMIEGTNTSWAITNDTINRVNGMLPNVTLGNIVQTMPHQIQDSTNNWTTLGVAVDWGQIQYTQQPAVFALGVVRSPSIQYATPSGSQERYPYFLSTYSNATEAARAFLDDFPRAVAVAADFDARILAAGRQYSSEYADLLALSARQLMGALDITISKDSDGNWNTSDVKVFMKNMDGIGSDQPGTTMGVNTVDTLYAAFPAFMYLNPELGGYLLTPLLEYQDSSQYTLGYAARNIGSAYPNATADNAQSPHEYGVEESANMLIMTLAYSQTSGNGSFLRRHYALLRNWTEYLVDNSFQMVSQKSADFTSDSPGSYTNQTNLSLKGIIGIACMARIAEIVGVEDDKEHFNDTATSYDLQWTNSSVPLDKSDVYFSFGDTNSNGLIYNLYADKLLGLGLVSPSVYQAATTSYVNSDGQSTFGAPLDNSRTDRTAMNWLMFSAATVTNNVTRNAMVKQIHAYAASSQSNAPFSSSYNPSTGVALSSKTGANSPAVGAIFSFLAVNMTISSSIDPSGTGAPDSTKFHTNAGAIAGGTIGGLAAVLILACCGFLFVRRRRRRREQFEEETKADPIILPSSPSLIDTLSYLRTPRTAIVTQGRRKDHKTPFRTVPPEEHYVYPSPSSSRQRFLPFHNDRWTSQSQVSREGYGPRSEGGGNKEQLREDVENLRRDLDRIRMNLSITGRDESLPSYSEPGLI